MGIVRKLNSRNQGLSVRLGWFMLITGSEFVRNHPLKGGCLQYYRFKVRSSTTRQPHTIVNAANQSVNCAKFHLENQGKCGESRHRTQCETVHTGRKFIR